MSKSILITGGAGFVGSSLAVRLKEKYPQYKIVAFDNLKRRGSELNLARLRTSGVEFLHGDVRIKEDFEVLPRIDLIIEASAEPSVLAGVQGSPDYVLNTNLSGTINCLDFAVKQGADFIFLSTSRVYPIENLERLNFTEDATRFTIAAGQSIPGASEQGISEEFPIAGYRSIYGATKLCSEILIQEYNHFYGVKTVINRCGVVTGPWQMGKVDQGVVVLWMARHLLSGKLDYFGYGGTGKQVRDLLHIDDLFKLVDHEIVNMDDLNGETFNIGGGREVSVSLYELTALAQKITGNAIPVGSVPETREADVRIYVTDNTKVSALTGWSPEMGVERILEDVHRWIVDNKKDLEGILDR